MKAFFTLFLDTDGLRALPLVFLTAEASPGFPRFVITIKPKTPAAIDDVNTRSDKRRRITTLKMSIYYLKMCRQSALTAMASAYRSGNTPAK